MGLRSFARDTLLREARARVDIVYAWERPSIMRKHIVTGAMGMVYFVLLSGIYLVAFGNAIGLKYWQWGVLSGASSFVLLLQLLSAYWVWRTGFRRSLWFAAALSARLLRAGAIVVAFALIDLSGSLARLLFVLLIVLSNCFDALAAPPWFSWLADIIPEKEHGSFMGRRSAWIAIANAAIVFPIGLLVDSAAEDWKLIAIMGVFAFGLVIGILDLLLHRTIPEPRMKRQRRGSFRQGLMQPLMDPNFRPWLIFNGCWSFAMTLGGALATVHFIENLGIKRNFMAGSIVLILLPLAATMLTSSWAGRLIDRHGVRPVLRWGYLLWGCLPAFWLVATPGNALLVLGLAAVTGSIASGAALNASVKMVTRARSSMHVPLYFAVSTCVGSIAGGAGPLVAGLALQITEGKSWEYVGLTLTGFHLLFALSLILRLLSTLLLRRLSNRVPHKRRAT
jgi:MFS family permease